MRILAIDSSGMTAAVALAEDGKLIAEYSVNNKKTHSQTLLPMLDQLKKDTELDLASVDAIALSNGPGSFTGLRIGSATAKGLSLALGKPLIEVPTLEALAWQFWGSSDLVCPMMDARRTQVYTAVYRFGTEGAGVVVDQSALAVEEIADQLNQLGEPVILLGDGADVYREKLESLLTVSHRFAPEHLSAQRAGALAACALQLARQGRFTDAAASRPDYLRVSQAERERSAKLLSCEIRRMRPEDVPEAVKIEKQIFTEPWSEEGFLSALAQKDSIYVTAAYQGHVIGYCGLLRSFETGEITNVAVEENSRLSGVGRRMLEFLMREAGALGVTDFTLEVRVSNAPAIHLYETLGFASEGIRPDFYAKPREDALIMWKREDQNA